MAKIDNTSHTSNNKRGTNKMPKGTMPKDKLERFKLNGNIEEPGEYKHRSIAEVKRVAKSARAIHTYRMYVHKCMEPRLPSSFRRTVHYFLTPMSRSDSDNSKDRRNIVVETDNAFTETSN